MRRMRGMIGIAPPMEMCFATQILVKRSARKMSAEMESSQGRRRGMVTGRPLPDEGDGQASRYPRSQKRDLGHPVTMRRPKKAG
jgi:hypothetical protein